MAYVLNVAYIERRVLNDQLRAVFGNVEPPQLVDALTEFDEMLNAEPRPETPLEAVMRQLGEAS